MNPSTTSTASTRRAPHRLIRKSTLVLSFLGLGFVGMVATSHSRRLDLFSTGQPYDGSTATTLHVYEGILRAASIRYSDLNEKDTSSGFFIPSVVGFIKFQGSPEGGYGAAGPKGWLQTGWRFAVNLWILAGALLIVPCFRLYRAIRRARAGVKGRCVDCEYDLRGIGSDICPECGNHRNTNSPAIWVFFFSENPAMRRQLKIITLPFLLAALGSLIYRSLLFFCYYGWRHAMPSLDRWRQILLSQALLVLTAMGFALFVWTLVTLMRNLRTEVHTSD